MQMFSRWNGAIRRAATAALVGAVLPLVAAGSAQASAPAAPSITATAPLPVATLASAFDATMVTLINQARAAAGVGALTPAAGLTRLSVWWSTHMNNGSTGYQLAHNPDAWTMLTSYGAANRTSWGENVAWSSSTASTAQQIFTAYMNSPGHKANILSRSYRYIGMGTITGAHGLWNTTEFADAVQPTPVVTAPAPAKLTNGQFVRDVTGPAVYRLVGGAPVFVSTWVAFGRAQPVVTISHAQFLTLPAVPADGTFVRGSTTHLGYRIVGGAPVFVSNWAPFGGLQPYVDIDPAAISHAGQTGYWSHLKSTIADGTFIRTPDTGAVYRMAGGAPLWVSTWVIFGGRQKTVDVDPATVTHAGMPGVWSAIRMYPADNTYIQGIGSPRVYRVTAGRAVFLTSWVLVGGRKPFVVVDPQDISKAGTSFYFSHLRK